MENQSLQTDWNMTAWSGSFMFLLLTQTLSLCIPATGVWLRIMGGWTYLSSVSLSEWCLVQCDRLLLLPDIFNDFFSSVRYTVRWTSCHQIIKNHSVPFLTSQPAGFALQSYGIYKHSAAAAHVYPELMMHPLVRWQTFPKAAHFNRH